MKYIKLTISIVLLLLASTVYALPPDFAEFLESAADAILKFFSELTRRLILTGMVLTKIDAIGDEFYDNLQAYLLKDPQPDYPEIYSITGYFIRILEPFYVTAMILTGMYLIFFSGSPLGRSRAKSLMLRLFVGMVVISLSLPIMQLLFTLSQDLTRNILSQGPLDIGLIYKPAVNYLKYITADFMWINIAIGIPFLIFTAILTVGMFAILFTRYMLLIFLIIFFPFAVFLGMFRLTRDIGQMIIKQLLFWIFLPVGYALALVIIAAGSQALTDLTPVISDVVNLSGTMLLIISPLIIFGLMNWLAIFAISSAVFIRPLSPLVVFFDGSGSGSLEDEFEDEEGEREGEPTMAVGVRGYEAVSAEGGLPEGEIKPALERMADMRGEISLEEILKNKRLHNSLVHDARERGTSLEEFVREKYGFRVSSGKAYGSGIHAGVGGGKAESSTLRSMRGKIPAIASKITPKKKGVLVITIPPRRVSPVLVVNVPPGETERLEIVIRNDGNIPFSKVIISDENLLSAGITIIYGENGFKLMVGEEKVIAVMISARENIAKASHAGGIIVETEQGIRSRVDTYVDTHGKGKEEGGGRASTTLGEGVTAPYMSRMAKPAPTPFEKIPEEEEGLMVTVPPEPTPPTLIVNAPPGGSATADLRIKNRDKKQAFDKVLLYDIDLLSSGIEVTYSVTGFRLEAGRERRVEIEFNPREDIKRKTYTGEIVIDVSNGVKSKVNVVVHTQESEEKSSEEETTEPRRKSKVSEPSEGEKPLGVKTIKPRRSGVSEVLEGEPSGKPPEEAPKEAPKESLREAPGRVSLRPSGRVLEEAPEEAPKESLRPSKKLPEEAPEEAPEESLREAPEEGPTPTSSGPLTRRSIGIKLREGFGGEGRERQSLDLMKPLMMLNELPRSTRLLKLKRRKH